jgi:hypothetical protein
MPNEVLAQLGRQRIYSREQVLAKPCPVPTVPGLYAWFFLEVPGNVPTDNCLSRDGLTLLYVGISPDKLSKPNSKSNLKTRIVTHYRGNAEGSTLRKSLGVLTAGESGFPLCRVGSGTRMTFTHLGEQALDAWMSHNAFVAWIEHAAPWEIEHNVLGRIACPLNISGNAHHPFSREINRLRREAIQAARSSPIAREHNMRRRVAMC